MLKAFSDHRSDHHAPPPGFPEIPARRTVIVRSLEGLGLEISPPEAHSDLREIVETTHEAAYVDRFERAVARGDGLLDSADNPLCAGTAEAVWGAVETAVTAADWMMAGSDRHAFAAIRPPGHHAESSVAMGFCFFNNIAIVADYLRTRYSLERVAIVDFDVHHGNGTQDIFYSRSDVLFISLHQSPFYPGSGAEHEKGVGDGLGATLNIPLAAGTDDLEYERAITEMVAPALAEFEPQALLVSAGFDAWQGDPLGGMRVSAEGYGAWGRLLRRSAVELCDGRQLSLLEGGYDVANLPLLVASYLGLS